MYILDPKDVLAYQKEHHAILIDARGGPDAYTRYSSAHAEGAYFVDLESQLSEKSVNAARGGRHPLPDMKNFGAWLGAFGITPSTHILVYDDKAGANAAARFWWMLKAIGHNAIYVVSGGLDAMAKAGVPISSSVPEALKPAAPYPVTDSAIPVVNVEAVIKATQNPDFLVIDVREGYRYRGESEPIDLVAGHIPGAVNVPFVTNLQADGKFLSPAELASKYREVIGNRNPEHVIVHCGSGVTACHTLLAMNEAGIEGAKLYVGSWSEWSRNDYPVAVGGKP
jgi:thiosulfate/3-mercaptopyruvate sulfurtransferase